jgi:chorismate mutase/prephenate dehydratase
VKKVYSHFTQIKHHAEWLKIHHPQAILVPVASTATASERAAADPKAAALASPGAAGIYKLDILATPSDGQEVNVTNFFTIARKPGKTSAANRTALVATLLNQCGSLHKFLGPFARQQVTLTRIVSRPVPGQPQTYVFYIEVEGAESDLGVARALELAKRQAKSISILGTFPLGRHFRS